jgi:hypothetical protein
LSWQISGSYFESCNCEAICPCRKINGVPGGRSTYGECLGVLSWVIAEGHADDLSLKGLKVALATRYHDDEPGSPWSFVMYVDSQAGAAQREALEGIFTGRLGGDALKHFPWAWKEAERIVCDRSRSKSPTSRGVSGCGSGITSQFESVTRGQARRPSPA